MASPAAFSVALAELCIRLWMELERLVADLVSCANPAAMAARAETLRLELIVLIDRCSSPRWAEILTAGQRAELRLLLAAVLDALADPASGRGRWRIVCAQDRLLDEIQACFPPERDAAAGGHQRTAS